MSLIASTEKDIANRLRKRTDYIALGLTDKEITAGSLSKFMTFFLRGALRSFGAFTRLMGNSRVCRRVVDLSSLFSYVRLRSLSQICERQSAKPHISPSTFKIEFVSCR